MLRPAVAALACALVCAVVPAAADVYEVRVPGIVAASSAGPEQSFVLTARFDVNRTVRWGDYGYTVAGLYGLPVDGAQAFKVESDGSVWTSADEYLDGAPFFIADWFSEADGVYASDFLAGPALVFDGSRVLGLAGVLAPQGGALLGLGSDFGFGYRSSVTSAAGEVDQTAGFAPFTLSSEFWFDPRGFQGGDLSAVAFRTGRWDFAAATVKVFGSTSSVSELPVSSAPEPSTWVLAILGFGFVGAALRRRTARAAVRARP